MGGFDVPTPGAEGTRFTMRIHYIADSVVPSRAANSVHVMKMCAALARLGHEVTLVVGRRPELELPEPDPYGFYGVPRSFHLEKLAPSPGYSTKATFAAQATWRSRRERPDLVYTRSLSAGFFSLTAGLDVVYESHTPEAGFLPRRIYPFVARHARLRTHVVITEALKRYYVETVGIRPDRLRVAPDGADVIRITEELTLGSGERCQVGYLGHLYPGRGIGLVVELAIRVPEADFHLIGGTEEDIEHWKTKVTGLGNVTFHGFHPPAQLDNYRNALDVLLAPYERKVSISGGGKHDTSRWMSPLKLFEYMAAGKAILASRLPALEEVVRDGETAVLCAPEDVDAWERSLRALLADPERRRRLGREAKRVFEATYTWDRRAEAILAGI